MMRGRTDGLTARDEVLLDGLVDWVALDRIHDRVATRNVGAAVEVIQDEVVDLIRSLVTDGLFEIGEIPDANSRFIAWVTSTDDSIRRIRDVYVTRFRDENTWRWFCWLSITEAGLRVARTLAVGAGPADDA